MPTPENESKQSPVVITGHDGESVVVAAHQSVVLQLSIPGRNARTAEIQLETPAECDRLTVAIQRAAVVAFDRQSPVNVSTAGGIGEALMAAHEDAERYKADHLAACETIAQMHAAATGRPGEGPIRGVVEDVTDLRERAVALEATLVALLPYADHQNSDPEGDCLCGLNDVRSTIQELIA